MSSGLDTIQHKCIDLPQSRVVLMIAVGVVGTIVALALHLSTCNWKEWVLSGEYACVCVGGGVSACKDWNVVRTG